MSLLRNTSGVTVYRTDTFRASAIQEGLDEGECDKLVRYTVDHRLSGEVLSRLQGSTVRRLPWKRRLQVTYVLDDEGRLYLIAVAPSSTDPDPQSRESLLQSFLEKLAMYGLFEAAKWVADKVLRLTLPRRRAGLDELSATGRSVVQAHNRRLPTPDVLRAQVDPWLYAPDSQPRKVLHLDRAPTQALSSNVRPQSLQSVDDDADRHTGQ